MRERDMVICDIVEEVDFAAVQGECGGDGVDWSVTPAFVEESAVLIKGVEEVDVGWGAEEGERADFEVGPLSQWLV
jgi:hypothetical protein